MKAVEYAGGRVLLGRLARDADILESATAFCAATGFEMGLVSVIGAVKKATIAFYDQSNKEYNYITFDEPLEIVSLAGNLSRKDGKPIIHAHAIFSRPDGQTVAGHLASPTIVYAGEISVIELKGKMLERGYDEVTGLPLWDELG